MTAEGWIAYLHNPVLGIDMPVRLMLGEMTARDAQQLHAPLRDDAGRLVYALPGGGRFYQQG